MSLKMSGKLCAALREGRVLFAIDRTLSGWQVVNMRTIDHDIIRNILFWASEADADGTISPNWPVIEKSEKYNTYSDEQFADWIEQHLRYLADREFIDVNLRNDDYGVRVIRLLSAGWDHLDIIKDDGFWKKIKEAAISKGKDLTFEFIKVGFKVYVTKALS